jgi:hypothetical protein
MAPPENVSVIVYYNGQCYINDNNVIFQSDNPRGFRISVKSTFSHLKDRILQKLELEGTKIISEIFYRHPVIFGTPNERFVSYQIKDNEDVQYMFATHSQFEALCSIELYVTLEDVHQIPTHQHQIETRFYTILSVIITTRYSTFSVSTIVIHVYTIDSSSR